MERLLQRLDSEIAAHPADQRDRFRIVQIKEKLGRLTVYLESEATPEMRRRSGCGGDVDRDMPGVRYPAPAGRAQSMVGHPVCGARELDASREVRVAATMLGEIELMRRLGAAEVP
jgi:hypothetical protein